MDLNIPWLTRCSDAGFQISRIVTDRLAACPQLWIDDAILLLLLLCGFPSFLHCLPVPLMASSFCFPTISDSDNSLLRYLSDDKILVIEEEPEVPSRESRRDSTRRSRRKSRNPSSPSFPISPSMLSSTLRLDQPPDALPVRTQSVTGVFNSTIGIIFLICFPKLLIIIGLSRHHWVTSYSKLNKAIKAFNLKYCLN